MESGVINHIKQSRSTVKIASYGNILIGQGYVTGNDTYSIKIDNMPFSISNVPVCVRNQTNGQMSIYNISDNYLVGWDGSTNRIFTNGVKYYFFFIYIY